LTAVAVQGPALRTVTTKSTLDLALAQVRVTLPPVSLHVLIDVVAAPLEVQI
jgi:hypothetical protein